MINVRKALDTTGRISIERHVSSQFKIWPKKTVGLPFHLCLALSNAKSAGPYWYAHNGGSFIVAALLHAIGIAELVDIETGIKRFYRHDEIHILEAVRELSTPINKAITRLACQRSD
jgi:hypothetical protein